jgi:hypothetical protein
MSELDLDIQGHNDDDGETITVTKPGGITGTREAGLMHTRMRITRDGPVMRYLLGGLTHAGTRVPASRAGTARDPA